MAACDSDAQVVDLTVPGQSSDFSSKTGVDTGQSAALLDGPLPIGGAFSACLELEASVDVQVTLAAAAEVEVDAPA